jgi:hypothetical protein
MQKWREKTAFMEIDSAHAQARRCTRSDITSTPPPSLAPHLRVVEVSVRIAPARALRRVVLMHACSVVHVVPAQEVTERRWGEGACHLPRLQSMRLQAPLSGTMLSANSGYICFEKEEK